jgi:ABC-2 type transport system permease protein
VLIEVFHHPAHAANIERMVRGVQASLDFYSRTFGPYPYGQIRLIEHPGDGNTLHAAPINISYEEGFSLFNPDDDPRRIDFPFAIVAHEVAHQWWGNQVTPAEVEGMALVSESLAWHSALGVIEETHGREHMERFLGMMREAYLMPNTRGAVPLLRAADWYLAYRKGAFAMYALREYVGAARVDGALRRLIERHGAGTPPLPTSRDLYAELHAVTPESLRPLLSDLFEHNTYWELATKAVVATETKAGMWEVTLEVKARKVVVDEHGNESEVPMDDFVEIGVYPAAAQEGSSPPLYQQLHRVRSGAQRITVAVPARPARAGIDPRNLLIDVKPNDNVALVTPH